MCFLGGSHLKYTILASGSTGNATLIETRETKVLVDCGISRKKLVERLALVDVALEDIHAVCITHRHADHIQGLAQVSKTLPVCVSAKLYPEIQSKHLAEDARVYEFEADRPFRIRDIDVWPHPVSHDCLDPVAFTLSDGEDKIGILTDLGEVTRNVLEGFKYCTQLLLEANHDIPMLMQSDRPLSLKNRILGKEGHLSNKASGRFLADVFSARLREVLLMHLSEHCNTPDLALETIRQQLNSRGIFFDTIDVAPRDGVSSGLRLEGWAGFL